MVSLDARGKDGAFLIVNRGPDIDLYTLGPPGARRAQQFPQFVNSTDDRNAAVIIAARQLGFSREILALVEDPYHRQPMILAGASAAFTPRQRAETRRHEKLEHSESSRAEAA